MVVVAPGTLAGAVADWADLGSTVSEANAAAAALTTGLVPAAEDEVSAAVAELFGSYAQDYHALSGRAAEYCESLVQALKTSAGTYVAAETANAAALLQRSVTANGGTA